MLRYLRLGDGMLARFNGVGCAPAAGLATVLAYDDGSLPPLAEARASGYARLERGATIVDRGRRPPPPLAQSAMRPGRLPVVRDERRDAAAVRQRRRAGPGRTATGFPSRAPRPATIRCTLAEKSSSRLIAHRKLEALIGAPPIRYPDRVDWRCEEADGAKVLEASHDGYHRRYELMHYRASAAVGRRPAPGRHRPARRAGQQGAPARRHALRHPLPPAPERQLRLGRGVNEAIVTLADGQRWRFTAQGAVLSIEESTYFAESAGPRPALQIVLRGATFGETEVNWVAAHMAEDDPARETAEEHGMTTNPRIRRALLSVSDKTGLDRVRPRARRHGRRAGLDRRHGGGAARRRASRSRTSRTSPAFPR